ncbi:MAG: TRAP transporter substrate-binding protein DctP [Candidatus Magnetomorum sp.]|nr:TRAP transporter substrate-binding protein DctP [Candidatus Magnetomorum sp.]
MKNILYILLLIFIACSWISIACANDSGAIFLQKCGSCHKKIRSFTPARYTSAQWRRFFDKNKHQRKKDISHLITTEERSTIKMYLLSHSKDSAEPDVVGFSQDKYVWKVGTLVPKNMGWAKLYREIILPVFNMVTNDTISVKIYWGDIIGDDRSIIQKMESGELDAGGISGYGTSLICPEMSVLNLPFLFNTRGEFDYVISKMGHQFDMLMDKRGYKLLLLTEQDFDQIYSRHREITRLSHFSGMRFGSWFGSLEKSVLKQLGSEVISSEDERSVYKLILQQHTVDAFIAPAMFVLSTNMYKDLHCIHQIKIRYANGTVVLRKEAWNAISPFYQERIQGYFKEYVEREFSEAVRRDNERSINAMIKYGIKDVKIEPKALEDIKNATKPLWFELADKLYPKEILFELLHHLEVYRKQMRER